MAEHIQIAKACPQPPSPSHVAIIMDGNGRWAKARNLPRKLGHREGIEAVRRTVQAAIELGTSYLTLYSFSSENWSRPQTEINDLMGLMKLFIRQDLKKLHENNVKIVVIGERTNVETHLLDMIDEGCELTANNIGLTLVIAFNYGARAEIATAARQLAAKAVEGKLELAAITPELLSRTLDTGDIPDPDLLIRTSGEQRLSNFLLWQLAYTEFVFLDVNWPDFTKEHYLNAIEEFHARERRYGGRPVEQVAP